ncbi:MAG: hypothetical protein ABL898_13285 [Hyphomicrobiaceae bacterium]|nr:hypothetical protein [Hyphomicrobiaceae bacterium]
MSENTQEKSERRLVTSDPDERTTVREAIEKAGRYETAKRKVYLALILAALGLAAALVSLIRYLAS